MKKHFIKKAVAMISMLVTVWAVNEAPHELYMKSEVIKYFGKYYNSLKLFLGTGSETTKVTHNFEIQFGRPNVLIGDDAKAKWGIKCGRDEPNEQTSCVYNSVLTV